MRSSLATVAAVVASAAVSVSAAHAATEIIPTGTTPSPQGVAGTVRFGGPALTRDGVAWAEGHADGTYAVEAHDAAGTRQIATGPRRAALRLGASGDRIGLLTESELSAGTLGGPFATIATCHAQGGCSYGVPGGGIAVADGAVAARIDTAGVDVFSFDPMGATAIRAFPTATGLFALAGDYFAAGDFDQTRIEVFDWRTGNPVYTVARDGGLFDIQADGTTVFQKSRTQLAYATVADPTPHPLSFGLAAPTARSDAAAEIAGNRVAITDGRRFAIEDLNGSVRNLPPVTALGGAFDFDGKRLAFSVQPCLVTSVVVWDVDDPTFPVTPKAACPAARPSVVSRHVSSAGRVAVRLRCPSDPLLGCVGYLDVGSGGMHLSFYDVPPGRSATLSVRLDAAQRRALRRHRSLAVRIASTANSPAAANGSATRRVRLLRPARRRRHHATCSPAHSHTVAQDGSVRIYRVAHGSGSILYGCRKATGRTLRLDEAADDGYTTSSSYGHVHLAGNQVAWVSTATDFSCKADCPPGYSPTTVRVAVADVATRRERAVAGDPLGDALVVTRTGAVAWAANGPQPGVVEVHASTSGSEDRVLDSGTIDPRSLTLSGTTLAWTNAGVQKSASL